MSLILRQLKNYGDSIYVLSTDTFIPFPYGVRLKHNENVTLPIQIRGFLIFEDKVSSWLPQVPRITPLA